MAATKKVPSHFTRLRTRLRSLDTNGRLAVSCSMSDLVNGARIAALIDRIARENIADALGRLVD